MNQQEPGVRLSEEDGSTFVHFDCWSCGASNRHHLKGLQEDRLKIKYSEVRPKPEDPQRYHIRCEHCGKFNTMKF